MVFSNDGSRDSTKMTILWYDNGQIWSQGYYKTVDTTNLKLDFMSLGIKKEINILKVNIKMGK